MVWFFGGLREGERLSGLLRVAVADLCGRVVVHEQTPLEYWQSKNWDPAVGSTVFDDFCTQLNTNATGEDADRNVTIGGLSVNPALVNYAEWIKDVRFFPFHLSSHFYLIEGLFTDFAWVVGCG